MSNIATIAKNTIAVRDSSIGDWRHLTIDCPEGWDDVKKIAKKVLDFDGLKWGFNGWNSDRNVCFFRPLAKVATFA